MSDHILVHGFGVYAETETVISVARELQTWLDETTPNQQDIPQVSIALVDYAAGINIDNETVWDSENSSETLSIECVKHLFIEKCKRFAVYANLESAWEGPSE